MRDGFYTVAVSSPIVIFLPDSVLWKAGFELHVPRSIAPIAPQYDFGRAWRSLDVECGAVTGGWEAYSRQATVAELCHSDLKIPNKTTQFKQCDGSLRFATLSASDVRKLAYSGTQARALIALPVCRPRCASQ
jgi:hypothetical protein